MQPSYGSFHRKDAAIPGPHDEMTNANNTVLGRRLLTMLAMLAFSAWALLGILSSPHDTVKPEALYKQDIDGDVCAAFDQDADYSKCGRLEPAFFYWWAREEYGEDVERACGSSASFTPSNPVPVSQGLTLNVSTAGNAWFIVCAYQALAHMDDFCSGTFVANPPSQKVPATPWFGNDGLQPTEEDISKGWTDPCAAHAFCTACDSGKNPFCKAYMLQRTHCPNSEEYRVHALFSDYAKQFWCSKVPEILDGTFEARRMSREECDRLYWS